MKWKNFLIGFAAGIAVGYVLKNEYKKPFLSPEKALESVKKAFKQKGPINGSWIYTIPQDYEKNDISYKVYQAGISRFHKGKTEQFEVVVDASSGTILHVNQLSS